MYTFQFIDGRKDSFIADSLQEALRMRFEKYGDTPWTIVPMIQEEMAPAESNEEKKT